MKRIAVYLGLASLLMAAPALAEEKPNQDAESYAEEWGISFEEAVERLALQPVIGELDQSLTMKASETFAGLWIEHSPFRVIVRFVGEGGKTTLADLMADYRLDGLVDIKPAKYTLEELRQAQEQSTFLVRSLGFEADSFVDVIGNRVEVRVGDAFAVEETLAQLGLALPAAVDTVSGIELMKPEALFHGGQAISTCTLGFSVRNSSGTRGVTTAAHCGNSQRWQGKNLQFRSERYRDNYDIQWHTSPGDSVTNRFESGLGTRRCTATRSRSRQSVGNYVCKNGRTTGYRCGYIQSKNFAPGYVPSVNSTFIYVDGRSTNLSEGGDSGGPWFNGQTAYGTHSGGAGNDSVYMPINYVSGISVSVLTR